MHEEKIALVRRQIEALAAAVASRNIRHVWVVACGGSLATLDPFRYILTAETDKVSAAAVNAAEFAAELPKGLGEDCLVVLNSQSGTTAETVRAAQLAKERGALTAAYTTAPESPLEQAVDFPIYYYDDPVNPYPLLLSIFPEVYQTVFALLDVWEGTKRLPIMETAMENLEEVCGRATASFKPEAPGICRESPHGTHHLYRFRRFRSLHCVHSHQLFLMESVWRHSSPLHAGELFHGACEAIDKETAVVAFLGIGPWRSVEERAVKFLQRVTDKLTVLDAAALDLTGIPAEVQDIVAPLVLHAIASDYCLRLSQRLGHPMSSRRYMGIMKY